MQTVGARPTRPPVYPNQLLTSAVPLLPPRLSRRSCRGRRINSGNEEFKLARLVAPARKGDRRLEVSTSGIQVGRWVRLWAAAPSATIPVFRRRLAQQADEVQEAQPEVQQEQQRGLALGGRRGAAGLATAAASLRRLLAANATAVAPSAVAQPGKPAPGPRFRPLTLGMLEAKRDAEELGLGLPEGDFDGEDEAADGSGGRAPALAAGGTLDAYIYGNNAVDSGSSECVWRGCCWV